MAENIFVALGGGRGRGEGKFPRVCNTSPPLLEIAPTWFLKTLLCIYNIIKSLFFNIFVHVCRFNLYLTPTEEFDEKNRIFVDKTFSKCSHYIPIIGPFFTLISKYYDLSDIPLLIVLKRGKYELREEKQPKIYIHQCWIMHRF